MEPVNKGELITFDDGEKYYVVDIIHDNNCKYVYMAKNEGKFEILLGKEILENGDVIIETLDNQDEIKRIMGLLAERYKDIIGS
jgi:hypothetical protein